MYAASKSLAQDLPPPGGYPQLPFLRNFRRRGPKAIYLVLGFCVVSIFGFAKVIKARHLMWDEDLEKMNARICLYPLTLAESERTMLKGMKDFESAEAEIMAKVPGWLVGDSVFFQDKWIEPIDDQLVKP